jgi:hypothetical protein
MEVGIGLAGTGSGQRKDATDRKPQGHVRGLVAHVAHGVVPDPRQNPPPVSHFEDVLALEPDPGLTLHDGIEERQGRAGGAEEVVAVNRLGRIDGQGSEEGIRLPEHEVGTSAVRVLGHRATDETGDSKDVVFEQPQGK